MKKKGFTLIELLAVIVILAIIALIAVPIVINIINDAKYESQKRSIDNYASSIKQSLSNYNLKITNSIYGNFESIDKNTFQQIITKERINIDYKGNVLCDTIVINEKGNLYLSNCTVDGSIVDYEYGDIDGFPILSKGLTPVIYKDNNWVVVPDYSKEWYDYDNQKWANAVVLGTDVSKNVGDTVAVDGTEAKMMLVWIPRYEYKIEGKYGTNPDGRAGTIYKPGEIKVNFINKNTTTAAEGYHLHPAFEFGEQQLNGIWVGKFEISYANTFNSICENEYCNTANDIRILPNKTASRYQVLSNYFYSIRSIENMESFNLKDVDTHLIKNSEWGAIAYLSQSKYGKYGNSDYTENGNDYYSTTNKEIYQNKHSQYLTGKSSGVPSPGGGRYTNQYDYDDMTNLGEGKGQSGPGASTTGTIYGVYDMSGGAYEYVMGIYSPSKDDLYSGYSRSYNSGFNGLIYNNNNPYMKTDGVNFPDSKYYDLYTNEDVLKACNNDICYGHALSEASGWYVDSYPTILVYSRPWIIRGGWRGDLSSPQDNEGAGIFSYGGNQNDYYGDIYSTRVVFTKK